MRIDGGTKAKVHLRWTLKMNVVMPRPRMAVMGLRLLIFPDLDVIDWEEGPTLPTIFCQGSPSQIWGSQPLCFCLLS